MSDAFLKEDFETVADYTSPLVFELVGGKANLIEGLKKSVEAMKVQQMKFQTISFEKPSEILSYNGQLQATIVQRTEIKYAGGTLKSISTLIAISADEGNTWKFIDTSGKDAIAIRKAFPRLSPDLRLPSGQQSVQ
jgi:hypothetical protein